MVEKYYYMTAGIVCVIAFQTEGKLYLVLEFLRGGDLFTRLSKEVSCMTLGIVPKDTNFSYY